jgi:hypothetical protein
LFFQNIRYREDMSLKTIFFIHKIFYKKLSISKLFNVKIKIITIIVLKLNSVVDLRKDLSHSSDCPRLILVNEWIKIIIIIVLIPHSGVNSRQSLGHGSGCLELTQVNIKTKGVIIIVLKPDLGANSV